MRPVPAVTVLLVGPTDRNEFRDARASIGRATRVLAADDVPEAERLLDRDRTLPDLIVLAQAYPGQFSTEEVDRLRGRAPIARVVGLLGSWCEGEPRSGKPWPAAIRVYWHQWECRFERELTLLREGRPSDWALPLTADEEERTLLQSEQKPEPREGRVVVWTSAGQMHGFLTDACRRRGYTTLLLRPGDGLEACAGATALLFDTGVCTGPDFDELRRLAACLPDVPIVVVMDFPRVEDRRRLLAVGAAAVLGKPVLLEDLYGQLDRV